MQANYVQRLRFRFSKVGPTRYISHLDLARALERALNRARVPLAYTQGYNRRPRMQMAAALPLGFVSRAEIADIWLLEELDPLKAKAMMMSKMAPGIVIHDVWQVDLSESALQTRTLAATYRVTPTEAVDLDWLREQVEALLQATSIVRERRGKSYDLRPLIESLNVETDAERGAQLAMRLSLLPGKTGRPDEVLAALGLDALSSLVERTNIVLEEEPVTA
ncbi:MAG: TIGR03936 family radical SAM-associated protein [Candidatus Promineifilaceae bacterium]|nr:TIGR03936 family radical SAM-associated protein [Candidatus Promineifilaceae bacterium]